jgi:hypothetical protein
MSKDSTKDLPVDSKLDELLVMVRSMDARLTSLEEKVDSYLKEDHLIWEGVLARLETLPTSDLYTRMKTDLGKRL